MRKYIYMIDYIWNKDGRADQCECDDAKDVLTQLKFLKNDATIENVKLVEYNNRYHEEDISYSLGYDVVSILKYRPKNMYTRKKGEYLTTEL